MNTPAIGIHFGSSYSCVGVNQFGKVEIIANEQGSRITPNYVAFTDTEILIGEAAENQSNSNPKNTIYDIQKLMGYKCNDVHILANTKRWPFQVTDDYEKPKIKVKFSGTYKKYFPEEISSILIGKMKETAEAYLGKTIRNAVITVPAHFNDSQRAATIDAAKFAGLNLLSIIDEPIAAAIAYGLEQKRSPLKVLVLDIDGGNFDVSILTLENGVFKVISNINKAYLDIDKNDQRMVNYFAKDFKNKFNKKPSMNNKKVRRRLQTACERARGILLSSTVANIDIESFYDSIDYHTRIFRAFFEELNEAFFRRVMVTIKKAIVDASIDKNEIDHVVLIGGSSRWPKIRKMLRDFLGEKDFYMSIHPHETIAYGAALQASILNGDKSKKEQNVVLTDCTTLSLGVNARYDEMAVIIERKTPIPTRRTAIFDIEEVNQSCMYFGVYEGEYSAVKRNHFLGQLELTGIHHAPDGKSSANITFEIDASGVLKVTAVQTWTGATSQLSIEYNRNRLSQFEIKRMVLSAEKCRVKEQEEKRKVALAAKNALKSYCSKFKDKIANFDKELILKKCEDTVLWLDSHQLVEKELYERKQKELENVSDATDAFINQVKIMLSNGSNSSLFPSQRRIRHPFLTNQITITHNEGLLDKRETERINEDTEKSQVEENKQNAVFMAKNSLLSYCIDVMSTVKDEESNIDEFDKNMILKKCDETIHWLNLNQSVEKEVYERKQEDLKTRFNVVNSVANNRRKGNDERDEALNVSFSKRHWKKDLQVGKF